MAATDISKAGSSIKVTVGTDQPKSYVNRQVEYSFSNAAGDYFYISFGTPDDSYRIARADLTIQTVQPANAAAGYTAMQTSIFP